MCKKLETWNWNTHSIKCQASTKLMACKKRVETSFQSVKVAINFWPARNANLGRSKRITYKASCSQFANLGSTNEKKKRKKKKHTHRRKRAKAQQFPRLEPALLTTKKKKNEKENTLKPVFWKIYWKKKEKRQRREGKELKLKWSAALSLYLCVSVLLSVCVCVCMSV